jgi:GNAT superfamily N-acetyltransferase
MSVSLDGITSIPPGRVGTIKTYLAMTARPALTSSAPPPGYGLARLKGVDAARYRAIFMTLGRRWLWWSRLLLDETALRATLDRAPLAAYAVTHQEVDCGLLELDHADQAAPDLAFLGLFEGHTGRGVGNWLMAAALSDLWTPLARRVTVNTCTLDDPRALGFYRRHGFAVDRQAIEIVPDPRRAGVLPPDAAPHIPML